MAFNIDRFRKERVYRCSGPISELRDDLERLRLLDMDVERSRKNWRQAALLCLAATFVLFVYGLTLDEGPEDALATRLTLWTGLVLLAGTVGCLIVYLRFRRLDLENRRYTLVSQVLHRLRRDIGPDAPVKLVVDLTPVDSSEKGLGKYKTSTGWNAEDFSDPWLTLQTRLLDGTHVRIAAVQRLRKRSRTRRSISGKYKTKYRKDSWALFAVQLRVKAERYPDLARMEPETRGAMRLPGGVVVDKLQVGEDRMALRTLVEREWDAGPNIQNNAVDGAKSVVMMLLSLYHVLHYSKELGNQAKAS
ncbi:hypothetical protein [Corallococcus macrosporus]|uniref:Uncharacterized protein n=1 Tax=Corallococcus macrosporus DSM 14697 TaxID=1189310 RepID=A0A286NVN4_9BACT|nr:hypothetical protein [Corallococcus macrosporus]ATB51229.1 hypothetical protein MYMAC_006887 [Corallococcus macrosporus DSM 14697]